MSPATRFGPYEIIRRLGKSMSPVYLALDTRANRRAALKLIKAAPDAVSRLVMESERRGAAIQQRLRVVDSRVIEVYDYGDLDGYFFIAMQYVEGRNLAEVLARDGRMSGLRAARIALEICAQIEKFHTFQQDGAPARVVHGDIKPSNIHLGVNETVRLLDFGVAKTLRPDRDFTFHQFGSPSYCSPERLGRSVLDQQADLWSVGATLYEMLAGSPPYQAEDTEKLEKLIRSRRPPRALPANCPAPLKAVVGKALSPHPERRYLTAAEFCHDLRAFLAGDETVAEREKRGWRRMRPTLQSARGVRKSAPVPAVAACVLAGMLLFIGTSLCARYWTSSQHVRTTLDWDAYQDLQAQFEFLGKYSPVEQLRDPLRAAYQEVAAKAMASGDYRKAEPALQHAIALGDHAPLTQARLAFVRDPHIALVRDYKTQPDRALGELREAERLGYKSSARDTSPIAEAFRGRGFEELEAGDLEAARRDFSSARSLGADVPDLRPLAPRRMSRSRRWR